MICQFLKVGCTARAFTCSPIEYFPSRRIFPHLEIFSCHEKWDNFMQTMRTASKIFPHDYSLTFSDKRIIEMADNQPILLRMSDSSDISMKIRDNFFSHYNGKKNIFSHIHFPCISSLFTAFPSKLVRKKIVAWCLQDVYA